MSRAARFWPAKLRFITMKLSDAAADSMAALVAVRTTALPSSPSGVRLEGAVTLEMGPRPTKPPLMASRSDDEMGVFSVPLIPNLRSLPSSLPSFCRIAPPAKFPSAPSAADTKILPLVLELVMRRRYCWPCCRTRLAMPVNTYVAPAAVPNCDAFTLPCQRAGPSQDDRTLTVIV